MPHPIIAFVLSHKLLMSAAALGTYALYNGISYKMAIDNVNNAEANKLTNIKEKVSIHFPSFKEPMDTLKTSLESIKNQNIVQANPKQFEYIYAATEGDPLFDEKYAKSMVDKVIVAPRGKLNARHVATAASSGDIIVSVDSDSFYGPNFLNMMLKPYEENAKLHYGSIISRLPEAYGDKGWSTVSQVIAHIPAAMMNSWRNHGEEVVGTTASSLQMPYSAELFLAPLRHVFDSTLIVGRGSTYTKKAYYEVGGFNTDIDQTNIHTIWQEEEVDFRRRLDQIGRVVYVDAPVVHYYPEGPSFRGIRSTYTMLRGKRALEYDTYGFLT